MSKDSNKPQYAIDIYKLLGVVNLDINEECYKDVAFSTSLEVGDSCDACEFLTEDPVYMIGGMTGMSAGNRKRCEKGYWEEDV